jgi:hypothetical protein
MIEKIVTGGQTGVDQASLKIASDEGIEIGGWCPKGGLDEKGNCILDKYSSLKETETSDPNERTKLNIEDSDGTLIIVPCIPLPEKIKDGTLLTIEHAKKQKKPNLIISLAEKKDAVDTIHNWMQENDIKILNIAGPRESNAPGIHDEACELFQELFASFKYRCKF